MPQRTEAPEAGSERATSNHAHAPRRIGPSFSGVHYAPPAPDAPASRWAEPPAAAPPAPAEPPSSTDDGSDESDDDSSLEDSLPPLPEPDRVSSASTISAVEVGL